MFNPLILSGHFEMVPGVGFEPTRLSAGDFESPASTSYTTRAAGFAKPLRYGKLATVSTDIWPMERAQGLLGSDLLIIQL